MNSENTPSTTESTKVSRRAAIQRGLRKGGMVATPVLMTSLGRSAMAGGNKSPSGMTSSGTKSHQPGSDPVSCTGDSPATWCTKPESTWNGAGCSRAKTLGDVFGASSISTTTMLYAMQNAGSAKNPYPTNLQVAGYLAAAYLNAKSGKTPVLKSDVIVNKMWPGCMGSGYSPVAGVTWDKATTINYINTQTFLTPT